MDPNALQSLPLAERIPALRKQLTEQRDALVRQLAEYNGALTALDLLAPPAQEPAPAQPAEAA